MNGFIRYLMGVKIVELTCADPDQTLTQCAKLGIQLDQPKRVDPLTVVVKIPASHWKTLESWAVRRGINCRVIRERSFLQDLSIHRKRIPFWGTLLGILLFCLLGSSRLWFLQVEGNISVSTEEILQQAQECGLGFWSKTRDIRSEEVKNQLLNRIPELQWVGVNLVGGVATITVSERLDEAPVYDRSGLADVVAARDGVILSMNVLNGQAVCKTGQAVRAGEILVTGCVEHEYKTQFTCADAEVYALTQRSVEAVHPAEYARKTYTGNQSTCIKVILGRKIIKIFGNSGIPGATCDKMIEVKPLTLPGGYELPLWLVIETYCDYTLEGNTAPVSPEKSTEEYLTKLVEEDMIAGEILACTITVQPEEKLYRFYAIYDCREMIARQKRVTLFEGENTNDRTNYQRRTGGGPD